jgi:DNA repair protein RadA/Sms
VPSEVIQFVCEQCGVVYQRWQGRCDSCGAWNSVVETVHLKVSKQAKLKSKAKAEAIPIDAVSMVEARKRSTGLSEMDFVLGGGVSLGAVLLLGGEPGIGKSTVALQVAAAFAVEQKVLYISGEESLSQINHRASRLGSLNSNLYVLSECNILNILETLKDLKPQLLILDSIQVVFHPELPSIPGSVNQVRYCSSLLVDCLKQYEVSGIIIGHITKDGALAGPKVLEHLVDVILYLEGEKGDELRVLRSLKNRYHSTNDIGLFQIKTEGLISMTSPSSVFLQKDTAFAGSVVSCICDGSRGVLIEIQALVHPTGYGVGKRTFLGVEVNRASLCITAIEKLLGIKLYDKDVILNIIGGIKSGDPALDLPIIFSILSSHFNVPLTPNLGILGEISLTGELRPIKQIDKRLIELSRMGFSGCVVPKRNKVKAGDIGLENFDIIEAHTLEDSVKRFFK